MKISFNFFLLFYFILIFALQACAQTKKIKTVLPMDEPITNTSSLDTAVLGAGCFWCVEAIYQELKGVKKVSSGYTGGEVKNPTYKAVCNGTTGHAEVAKIIFDSSAISYAEILEVFWQVHDPTTLNRQGNDVGTQYRSAIFYLNDEQKRIAALSKEAMDESGSYPNPVVTEISPLGDFYVAEDYHQNYFALNPNQPYCSAVVRPKVEKFKKLFQEKLKSSHE